MNTGKSFIYACISSKLASEQPDFVKDFISKLVAEFAPLLAQLNFLSSRNLLVYIAELYNLGECTG